jgi:hypothetical protein
MPYLGMDATTASTTVLHELSLHCCSSAAAAVTVQSVCRCMTVCTTVALPFGLLFVGLWEFMTNEECVAIAAQSREPRLAVEALITEANDRWMKEEQVSSTD